MFNSIKAILTEINSMLQSYLFICSGGPSITNALCIGCERPPCAIIQKSTVDSTSPRNELHHHVDTLLVIIIGHSNGYKQFRFSDRHFVHHP